MPGPRRGIHALLKICVLLAATPSYGRVVRPSDKTGDSVAGSGLLHAQQEHPPALMQRAADQANLTKSTPSGNVKEVYHHKEPGGGYVRAAGHGADGGHGAGGHAAGGHGAGGHGAGGHGAAGGHGDIGHGAAAGHGAHGGDAHGHGGHEAHGQHQVSKEAAAYSYCLMGGVAAVMGLFYLVNWHIDEIKLATWQTLNMTISIFCAVLMYGGIKTALQDIFGIDHHDVGGQVILLAVLFVAFYGSMQYILYIMKDLPGTTAQATSTIFAHLAGFAAMYGAAGLQALSPFNTSVLLCAVLTVVVAMVQVGLALGGQKTREVIAKMGDGRVEEDEERWMEEVSEAENDVLSLCVGFSIMQVIRFLICGELQAYSPEDVPQGISQWQTNQLLIWSVVLALCTFAGTFFASKARRSTPPGSMSRRLLEALQNVSAMAMAWSLLFWGEWQIYVLGFQGERISGCLVLALGITALVLVLVFALVFAGHLLLHSKEDTRALRSLVVSLGLLVGFTWERAFDIGLEDLSMLHGGGKYRFIEVHILPLLLLIVVMPAWAKYVLPKAVPPEGEEKEEGEAEGGERGREIEH